MNYPGYMNFTQGNVKNNSEAIIFYENEDKYLCYGRPADSQVRLPIGSGQFELNAACMLEQMRKIVDSGFEYDLHTHNCSTTALSILNAGREGKVKKFLQQKYLLQLHLKLFTTRQLRLGIMRVASLQANLL